MIRTFRDDLTRRVFDRESVKRLDRKLQRAALRRLMYLNGAASLMDLRELPGNRLEKLYGDREGQYSIRINDQWRLCFVWVEGDAFDVEITDYH